MLLIGDEFDPTACITCEVRTDCAASVMAEKIGSSIMQHSLQAEIQFGNLTTDLVLHDDIPDKEQYTSRLQAVGEELWTEVVQLRSEFSEFLQRSAEVVFSFIDGDAQDEMGLTHARDGILKLLNDDFPAVRQVNIQSKEVLAGILALERHEPSAICGAVELNVIEKSD